MTDRHDLDPSLSAEERERLTLLAERLERDRPLPRPAFRGELGRRLLGSGRRSVAPAAARFRLWAASYAVAGTLCLAVAAIGLVGAGPFAV